MEKHEAVLRDTALPKGKMWTKGPREQVQGLPTEQQKQLQTRRVEQEPTEQWKEPRTLQVERHQTTTELKEAQTSRRGQGSLRPAAPTEGTGGKPKSNTENRDDTKEARAPGGANKTAKKQSATSPGALEAEEETQQQKAIKEEKENMLSKQSL